MLLPTGKVTIVVSSEKSFHLKNSTPTENYNKEFHYISLEKNPKSISADNILYIYKP